MVYQLKPRKCEHCEKDYLLRCHCQITPEECEANRIHTKNMIDRYMELKAEFEANRIHTKNMIDRYMELKAEFERKHPGLKFDAVC